MMCFGSFCTSTLLKRFCIWHIQQTWNHTLLLLLSVSFSTENVSVLLWCVAPQGYFSLQHKCCATHQLTSVCLSQCSVFTNSLCTGNVQHLMRKSGVEWLPRELPSGSGQMEGPHGPDCKITCNGRPTWFGAFLPCFGELKVDCEAGSRSLHNQLAGSDLDTTKGTAHGFEFHGACKGFWSGALFKSCKGFSTAHVEVRDKEVWDFCAGKKTVRMGARPGKGFFSASACHGKDLVVVEKDEE